MSIKTCALGLVSGFIGVIQYVITIHSSAIPNSHRMFVVYYSTLLVPPPVLWHLLPTADVPLLGHPNCRHATTTITATATVTLDAQCTRWNCI
jgi:hypothetical protein